MRLISMTAALAFAAVAATGASAQLPGEVEDSNGGFLDNVYLQPLGFDRSQRPVEGPSSRQYAQALQAMAAKDYAAAQRLARTATNLAPGDVEARKLLAAAQMGGGDWRGAARTYAVVVRVAPADPVGHAGLGVSLAMLDDAKAQAQLTWLTARVEQCAGRCPDAGRLAALTGNVETALNASRRVAE